MTGNFNDHLSERLGALGTDISGIRMAGPAAARERAAQRTRNQVTGGVLAGVAVIALGFASTLQDDLFTAPDPAQTETPTTVPSPPDDSDNTENPTPTGDTTIPEAAFMTIEDIMPDDGLGTVGLPKWVEGDATSLPFECAPAVPDGDAYKYYENDQEGYFLQFAEISDDPVRRFSQLRADLESCLRDMKEDAGPEAPDGLSEAWTAEGVGDEAWMATYWSRREQPYGALKYNLVSVRLVRAGSHVTMVIDGGPGDEDHIGSMQAERSETAAKRLCEAISEECVGNVKPTRLYPEPAGDIAGWLTVDDIVEATGLDNIAEGSNVMPGNDDASPSGWSLAYLPLDPVAEGATSFQERSYFDPVMQPDGPTLYQETATFPDDRAAREHYEALVAALENPTDDEIENIGTVDEDGHLATAWRAGDFENFVLGVLVRGPAVTAVSSYPFAGDEVTAGQMLDLLARAGDRLAAS